MVRKEVLQRSGTEVAQQMLGVGVLIARKVFVSEPAHDLANDIPGKVRSILGLEVELKASIEELGWTLCRIQPGHLDPCVGLALNGISHPQSLAQGPEVRNVSDGQEAD